MKIGFKIKKSALESKTEEFRFLIVIFYKNLIIQLLKIIG